MDTAPQPAHDLWPALRDLVARVLPGAVLVEVSPLAPDPALGQRTTKAIGYGDPLRLLVQKADGGECVLVFHTARSNVFGHDRRADRAAEMLLSYDRFGRIPNHSRALDIGAIKSDRSSVISLADAGEFYLLTSYADGHVYADELRRIAREKTLNPQDRKHCEALVRQLFTIHQEKYRERARYIRHLRDVVGSGEGIFGIVDGYPDEVPAAPRSRLEAIERRSVEWRFRLRDRAQRLSRIHGDYHPFNVVIDDASKITLLDASRGCMGDPADDVACMAINYVFFAVEEPAAWKPALSELYYQFWDSYLALSGDQELLQVVAPFLAWRALVICNPTWYPEVGLQERDRMLRLIERVLEVETFDPSCAEELF